MALAPAPTRRPTPARRSIERMFSPFWTPDWWADSATVSPDVDIRETGESFEAAINVPGIPSDDIELTVDGRTLTVRGTFPGESTQYGIENYLVAERPEGNFARSFTFPMPIEADRVESSFDRGVLRISIPKSAEGRTRRIPIRETGSQGQPR